MKNQSEKRRRRTREPATKQLIYLDDKGIHKEIKKLKKSIRAFMLLDREM